MLHAIDAGHSALRPRRRGHDRGQPGERLRLDISAELRERRHQPHLLRHAKRPAARAGSARPAAHPGRVAEAVGWARAAGFEQVSVDLIYGTPGESDDDWRISVDAALALDPDHISAYALIVEDGTRLARQVRSRRGARPPTTTTWPPVRTGRRAALTAAGLRLVRGQQLVASRRLPAQPGLLARRRLVGHRSRRAQLHRRRPVRWWNVRHPAAYAARLGRGQQSRCRSRDPRRAAAIHRGRPAAHPPGRRPADGRPRSSRAASRTGSRRPRPGRAEQRPSPAHPLGSTPRRRSRTRPAGRVTG